MNEEDYEWKIHKVINHFTLTPENHLLKLNHQTFINENPQFCDVDMNEDEVIEVDSHFDYEFRLNGEVKRNQNVLMFILAYDDSIKKDVFSNFINRSIILSFNQEISSVKIVLRFESYATLKINELIIKKKKRVGALNVAEAKIMTDEKIPYSNLKIALIADKFTETCLRNETNITNIKPNNWKNILTLNVPDLLFVESTWHGDWEKKVAVVMNYQLKELEEVVNWCKENKIPTVFWNKEDPVHFSQFIEAAKLFDYIFTTDENMIPLYKRLVKTNEVYALPFAAQPKIHNPIVGINERKNKLFFAGSYNEKYNGRTHEIDLLFNCAKEFGLDIYDRNFNGKRTENKFPTEFSQMVVGNVTYEEMNEKYKEYKVGLNVNSVNNSNTMFSRRVFEILACNTPIISSESKGINHFFEGIVLSSNNKNELADECQRLFNDEMYYKKKALLGLREVMSKHTYEDRLKLVLSKTNLKVNYSINKLTVLAIVKSQIETDLVTNIINNQSYKPDEVIMLGNDSYDKLLSEIVKTEYVGILNPSYHYGHDYLLDLFLATKYSDALIISKPTNKKDEYKYTQQVKQFGCIMNKDIMKYFKISDFYEITKFNQIIENLSHSGYKMLNIDEFNYNENQLLLPNSLIEV